MPTGLATSRLIRASVNLSPLGAQYNNLNGLLIVGASPVIGSAERVRPYSTLEAVAADFGITAPEYYAAALYFAQSPQPTQLYIGRWDSGSSETSPQALIACANASSQWYAAMFAASISPDAHVACAAYIQGLNRPCIYGATTTDPTTFNAVDVDTLAARVKALGYTRTIVQYSQNPQAIASLFGRVLTTNFAANNSLITLMYKTEPSVVPESLTDAQADVLKTKRVNVFVNYANGTAILQHGTMSGPAYLDEIYGLDWLQNRIQTDVFNLLYTSPTKVPQTDAGTHLITTTVEAACAAGVNNGLLAPGVWGSGGFGQLAQGDFMPKGYYVFAPPIALQGQADREARKSVPIQVAAKLAGAIHTIDVLVSVNR